MKASFLSFSFVFFILICCSELCAQKEGLSSKIRDGKCYERSYVPDQYETVSEQVLIKEVSKRFESTIRYVAKEEKIMVQKAYPFFQLQPSNFSIVEETILLQKARVKLAYYPPTFDTITEQVLLHPKHQKWQKTAPGHCCIPPVSPCIAWEKTEVPEQYQNIKSVVLKTPSKSVEISIPPQHKTIQKAIIQQAAQINKVNKPALYRTVTKQQLDTSHLPDSTAPVEYTTIHSKRLVRKGEWSDWVEVDCE